MTSLLSNSTYIHCTSLLYSNCRVAHPGTLLVFPIFSLPMELGKSLYVQEHGQTNWFFYENINYKTKNSYEYVFRFNGFGHNVSTYIHHLCI